MFIIGVQIISNKVTDDII